MNHRTPRISVNPLGGAAALWSLAGTVLAAWLALSGVLLAVRIALGAAQSPSWRHIMLATVCLLLAAWMSHTAIASARDRRHGGIISTRLIHALTSSGLLCWAISLTCVSDSRLLAAAILPLFIASEAWAWRNVIVWRRQATSARPAPSRNEARIVQQSTRSLTMDGQEIIQGRVAVRIEPGSRMAAAHVAFCPPFAERPHFEAHLLNQAGGTLKVTQLYAHGARLEVRLPQATAMAVAFRVRFTASSSQPLTNSSVAHKLGSSR